MIEIGLVKDILCVIQCSGFGIYFLKKYYVLEISKNYLLKVQNILTYGSNNKGLMEIIISSEKTFFILYSRFIPFPPMYLLRYAKKHVPTIVFTDH